MKLTKKDLVEAEIKRADEAFTMCGLAIEAGLWNSWASQLYYTCFYLVQAIFIVDGIEARTHAGMKSLFSFRFIKENRIDEKYGRLFSKLFAYRQEGDYGQYELTGDAILPFKTEVENFKRVVLALISEQGYTPNKQK